MDRTLRIGAGEPPVCSVGLDIDGTITENPRFFTQLARTTRAAGHAVHVVSSRSPSGASETREELRHLGLEFDHLFLLPDFGGAITACPHPDLSWYERYLWQKVNYCHDRNLGVFYDDDPRVLALFARFAPDIQINTGWR